ncbi:hypothetical protein T484DRAFT_1837398 [Baffinella frigidus]|nr:hypothetical protein T484DRAFT_1837398 [Cryptophyta sp. CCMP2293]
MELRAARGEGRLDKELRAARGEECPLAGGVADLRRFMLLKSERVLDFQKMSAMAVLDFQKMSAMAVRALLRDGNPALFAKDYTATKEEKNKGPHP